MAFAQYFPNWNVHFDRLPNALAIRCNETLFNENAIYNVVLSVIRNADSNCNAGARVQTEKEPVLFKDDPDPSVEVARDENGEEIVPVFSTVAEARMGLR